MLTSLFGHLHTHSCYSFLEGLPTPEDLVHAAVSDGMPALALTDHRSLTGAISFYRACREAGVKPILGLEIDLSLPYLLSSNPDPEVSGRLVLLAQNIEGWRNLCRLSSALLMKGENNENRYAAWDEIETFSSGLICLTGGCNGAVERLLNYPEGFNESRKFTGQLKEVFTDRLYIQINSNQFNDKHCNDQLTLIAKDLTLPMVAANPIYYLDPDHSRLQRTVSAIREITTIQDLPIFQSAPPGSYFYTTTQSNRMFQDMPDALKAVDEVINRCDLDLPLGKPNYPKILLPEGLKALDVLRQKAEKGAVRLYGEITPELRSRLETELSTIASSGYEPIFLIAEEMVSYAHKKGIPSASRGSASSSLVAHCMGITTPDPLELDLYFERFLNPARTTPPDIDTDFCSRRRDDVIQHLFDTYGQTQVAMVGTVNTYRSRSALADVAKAHGVKPVEIRTLTRRLSYHYRPGTSESGDLNDKVSIPYAALIAEFAGNERYQEIFRQATQIIGLPHHLSVHPGGIVIAPGPITEYVPVTRSGGKGITITQFDLDDVERVGLVKLDLLGIRGLTVLGDVVDNIYSWRRKEFLTPLDILESVPPDDAETAALVASGRTIGCFQIESPGMRATLKEIQAKTPGDIMAALALYRPGPLKGGLRDAFVRRHKHQEPVIHIHPALSGVLKETHGVILYQEQVLRIAHELAGLSLAEADLLRRAMSHFDPGKQMKLLEDKFIEGAQKYKQIPPEIGLRIWEMMAAFAGYGFPKAHAASYAQVAWRSAWCKAHYTPEFLAAVLANWGGYYPQSVYLNEARRLKLKVRPPHINHSRSQFSVVYPQGEPILYMGLDQLHGLTHRTQTRIFQFRPFQSLPEFLAQVNPRKHEVENLIQVGAFENIGRIPELLDQLSGGRQNPGQLSLFSNGFSSDEDWSLDQKITAQQRLLGVSLEIHPIERFSNEILGSGAISTIDAVTRIGETVRVAGIRQTIFQSLSANGEWIGTVTIEDLEGMLDIILAPQVFRRTKNLLSTSSIPFLFEGTIESDPDTGEPFLYAQKVWRID